MLDQDEKISLCQISLTGIRSLVLLGLLVVAPRSLEEIREAFLSYKILEPSHSNDILRIDINTLKAMGCKISRASIKTNYKYVLYEHPFGLKIKEEDIKVLKRVYKHIKNSADINLLIQFDDLFKKIASYVFEQEMKEALLGISFLKHYDAEMIKNLVKDCEQGLTLEIEYRKPTAKNETVKEIVAQKVVYKNDQIYLYGFDLDKKESVILNIKRFLRIISKTLIKGTIEQKTTIVKFKLYDFGIDALESTEKILDSDKDGYIVEGYYYNEFLAIQRMLSFGKNCTVLEPIELREKIVEKLKEMRKVYGN